MRKEPDAKRWDEYNKIRDKLALNTFPTWFRIESACINKTIRRGKNESYTSQYCYHGKSGTFALVLKKGLKHNRKTWFKDETLNYKKVSEQGLFCVYELLCDLKDDAEVYAVREFGKNYICLLQFDNSENGG